MSIVAMARGNIAFFQMASNPTDLPGPLQPVVSFHISATDISLAAPKTQEKNNRQSSRDILGTRQRSYNILSDERVHVDLLQVSGFRALALAHSPVGGLTDIETRPPRNSVIRGAVGDPFCGGRSLGQRSRGGRYGVISTWIGLWESPSPVC
ncbi:hypothetical protein HZ326_8766 [Fusarium oxysporum f. sp. albedinis]|jgi:hypothetical protein|nr:hypothetical protein HZ326_8766 [Fusarium oxysporum f. sp. albedinis]